jgi:hypothetical protein
LYFGLGYPYYGYGYGYAPYYGYDPYSYGYDPYAYDGYSGQPGAPSYDYSYPSQQYPSQQYPQQQYPSGQYPSQQYPSQQYPPQAQQYPQQGQPQQPVTNQGQGNYYLIAFTSHTIESATAYKVEGGQIHWVTLDGQEKQAPLSSVDMKFSRQLNRDRNVDFQLP